MYNFTKFSWFINSIAMYDVIYMIQLHYYLTICKFFSKFEILESIIVLSHEKAKQKCWTRFLLACLKLHFQPSGIRAKFIILLWDKKNPLLEGLTFYTKSITIKLIISVQKSKIVSYLIFSDSFHFDFTTENQNYAWIRVSSFFSRLWKIYYYFFSRWKINIRPIQ